MEVHHLEKSDFEGYVNTTTIEDVYPDTDLATFLIEKCESLRVDSCAVLNVTEIERKFRQWRSNLGQVTPFYAIKCNNHPALVRAIKVVGGNRVGFDCASPAEVRCALSMGATARDIIYANPMKTETSIISARELLGDDLTVTLDSEHELRSMLRYAPGSRLVIRLLPPDESCSICQFGVKFGASRQECIRLIRLCHELGGQLVGFSFHVGSGCGSSNAFALAVQYMGEMARFAYEMGFDNLDIIDIGGGFTTEAAMRHFDETNKEAGILSPPTFEEIALVLNRELALIRKYFAPNVRIIAEPGRFFASDVMHFGVRVYGRRVLFDNPPDYATTEEELFEAALKGSDTKIREVKYYTGDGMYGYSNCIMFDHAHPNFTYVRHDGTRIDPEKEQCYLSMIFGPTCDSADAVLKNRDVPLLNVNDYLLVKAFGAYTYVAATPFNGIPVAPVTVVREVAVE